MASPSGPCGTRSAARRDTAKDGNVSWETAAGRAGVPNIAGPGRDGVPGSAETGGTADAGGEAFASRSPGRTGAAEKRMTCAEEAGRCIHPGMGSATASAAGRLTLSTGVTEAVGPTAGAGAACATGGRAGCAGTGGGDACVFAGAAAESPCPEGHKLDSLMSGMRMSGNRVAPQPESNKTTPKVPAHVRSKIPEERTSIAISLA